MLKSFFITACRNLARHKGFALINVLGLTIGVACCLLIFVVVEFESGFDGYQHNKDRIFRVVTKFDRGGNIDYTSGVSIPVADAIRTDFPQLESVAMILGGGGQQITLAGAGETTKKFNEPIIFYVQPQVFQIFDIKWLSGEPKTALSEPNTVVLSRAIANKYFGDWKSAMGKTIRHNNRETLKITGVTEDLPQNTDFPFQIMISFVTSFQAKDNDWGSTGSDHNCMILLKPNVLPQQVSALLPAFRSRHAKESASTAIRTSYLLQPLRDIHFDDRFGNYNERTFSRELIAGLSLIAIFLLVIACVNFINLATAKAVTRAKEVGIRKVLGSMRSQLITQFLGETLLTTQIAIVLACMVARLSLPYLGKLLDVPLPFPTLTSLVTFLSLTLLAVTMLSGFYPAILLSRFNPIQALKSRISSHAIGGVSLRRGLVVLQFVVAQLLIIGTLVVISQMNYMETASMGFDKTAIVNLPVPGDSVSHSKMNTLRQDLLNVPGIRNLSFSFAPPANNGDWTSEFTFNHSPKETSFEPTLKWADNNYFNTYGLQFVAGHPYAASDTVTGFVVNESLVKKLGLRDPADILGKEISFWNRSVHAPVVGVVKDFHANSFREPIAPVVMGSRRENFFSIGLKIEPTRAREILAAVEKIWNRTFPDY